MYGMLCEKRINTTCYFYDSLIIVQPVTYKLAYILDTFKNLL